ncbi:MAG: hypothetical protein R3C53_22420 [Pirellulaceae bacterium]
MIWVWGTAVVVLVALLVWANIVRGMDVKDRIDIALELVRSSRFTAADGIAEAVREDPSLVGWVKSGGDCIMLFRQDGEPKREIIDFASSSFHPGLVIHYRDGHLERTDAGEVSDRRILRNAEQLLREVRQLLAVSQGGSDFGFRE